MRNLKHVWVRPHYAIDLEFDNGTWKMVEMPWDMEHRTKRLEKLRDRAYKAAWYAGKAAMDESLPDAVLDALDNVDTKAYDRYNKLDELINTIEEMLEGMDRVSEQMDFVFDCCKEFTIKEEEIA